VYLPLAILSVVVWLKVAEAMQRPVSTGAEGLRDAESVVVAAEGRYGVVRVRGELWNALSSEPLAVGMRVRIEELRGLTAIVRPSARQAQEGQ
jgi:membrane-bound serine protease (ClpP class)